MKKQLLPLLSAGFSVAVIALSLSKAVQADAKTNTFLKDTQNNRTLVVEPRRIRAPYNSSNRPPGQAICDCPYDINNANRMCGGTSAYARLGGKEPACYEGENAARQLWWNNPSTQFVDSRRTGK
jgi:hypothetical protein